MANQSIIVFLLLHTLIATTSAFAPSLSNNAVRTVDRTSNSLIFSSGDAEWEGENPEKAGRNPDKPELPELKGDYNWDEKFGDDPDWITENVPGKIVLSDLEIAAQATALTQLEDKFKKVRLQGEYDDARILGWTGQAETFNGRFAMFFLVVGLLTEYWTGVTIPGQVEEMLRVGGFIGVDF
mmetsp:Transcript_3407/g.3831  ORF Transcript_3407/g.3831 Transcript_3407/m.3831 type:complete len:182 (-) Transcript_3407:80-625(-)|eukprot:CAMPEP_0198259042 /NCGR_PEP_ID=MMETSP1447-20131203/8325_1 /TAXON_ID=420782 /ORGANISM="Chaetoceros dichaeta, Strain CCMP1751" /LENGTH=181 /DNA_ID=CAMNT_0043946321 /DNA_START=31 /DNA_END=576 /DNA_ORIENTATION=-